MFTLGIIGFLIVTLAVLGTWQRRIDRQHKQKTLEELRDAVHRGTHKPLSQYPRIDPYLCVGCGSCIAACPEDGVIGLVNGIAHIIHGSRCVGHGRCEEACPVGAIKVGLGDVALRPDIPILSPELETSVPGIFIAGELGGLALIRNAFDQGCRVVDAIARRLKAGTVLTAPGSYDLLIVGAGPAGLAASLAAIEKKLTYVTISLDDVGGAVRKYPRRKLTLVQEAKIPLYGRMTSREYAKEEIVELWDKIISRFNVKIQTGVGLLNAQRKTDLFEVTTTSGALFCRAIVLALGRRGTPRKLSVPGEEAEKVFYQLVDTASYTGQNLLIVGGGDSAVEAATGLANQPGNTVTVSYRKEDFFRLKSRNEQRIREYMAQNRLRVLFSSQVESIAPKEVLLKVGKAGTEERLRIRNDYVFIFAGGDPPYPLLKKMGIRFGGNGNEPLTKSA
jgi:thioredoxin reductase/NAD-dependent dihydropyrimidine dehydrogenase PreA subunit